MVDNMDEKELLSRAFDLAERDDYAGALQIYRELASINPDDAWLHLFIGNLVQPDDLATAKAEYRLATELSPLDGQLLWLAAQFFEDIGEIEEAISLYWRSASAEPDADTYSYLGEVLEAAGRHSEAMTAYQHAYQLSPTDVLVKSYFAQHGLLED